MEERTLCAEQARRVRTLMGKRKFHDRHVYVCDWTNSMLYHMPQPSSNQWEDFKKGQLPDVAVRAGTRAEDERARRIHHGRV